MRYIEANLNGRSHLIERDMETVVSEFNPFVEKIEDNDGYYSVLIRDKNSEFSAWIDISITEQYQDINAEWNQYIFYDNDDDVFMKKMQENEDVYELASSLAIQYLVDANKIIQRNDATWHNN